MYLHRDETFSNNVQDTNAMLTLQYFQNIYATTISSETFRAYIHFNTEEYPSVGEHVEAICKTEVSLDGLLPSMYSVQYSPKRLLSGRRVYGTTLTVLTRATSVGTTEHVFSPHVLHFKSSANTCIAGEHVL